jgi:hypothetical protein
MFLNNLEVFMFLKNIVCISGVNERSEPEDRNRTAKKCGNCYAIFRPSGAGQVVFVEKARYIALCAKFDHSFCLYSYSQNIDA